MKLLKRIPLTLLYLLMYWIVHERGEREGLCETWITAWTPAGNGEVEYSLMVTLFAIMMVIFALETIRTSRFMPKDNDWDAFLSIFIAVGYMGLYAITPYFQNEIFGIITFITLIDALVGLKFILSMSRRDISSDHPHHPYH